MTGGLPPASEAQRPPRQAAPAAQLHFSWNAPAPLPENLSTCFASPPPILIEKLKPPEAPRRDAGDGLGSAGTSLEFSALSEEKLQRAVQLARRDMKRRQLSERLRQHLSQKAEGLTGGKREEDTGLARAPQARPKDGRHATGTGAKVYLSRLAQSGPPPSDSPPTRDPGPGPPLAPKEKADTSAREVRRLQKELRSYVQKVEEMAQKERSERTLDPEEERRAHIRRQEQTARSARMLYVLQQQVKEIQEDLEQLSPRKIRHTKKSRAMARLAAAHRGAIRALQTFVSHFASRPEQPPAPAHCRELGLLIRQLSLCSARLEMEPFIPEVVLDLLLQIEDLDSLLAKKASPRKGATGLPVPSQAGPPKGPLHLARWEKKASCLEPRKLPVARKLLPEEHPELNEIPAPDGRNGDRRGPVEGWPPPTSEAPGQDKGEAEEAMVVAATEPGSEGAPLRRKGMTRLHTRQQGSSRPPQRKAVGQPSARSARFRNPTVSFQLKETKPPVRENLTPWVPPSFTSPLASPHRQPERSPRVKEASLEREAAGEGKHRAPAKKEPLRSASISQMVERVEREVRERLEPFLAKAQKVNLSLEKKMDTEKPLGTTRLPSQETQKAAGGGDLEDAAGEEQKEGQRGALPVPQLFLGISDLEAMLQRMEEIERSEEAMRRRYHQLVYSDLEFCIQEEKGREGASGDPEPGAPPPPIQITRQESLKEPHVEIVLERPLDTNTVEGEEEEETPRPSGGPKRPLASPLPSRKGPSTFLSVPPNVLQSIRDYGERYEQHLKRISHEAVGNFDPWHIAESLAGELVEEALAEVAEELQGLCEDYAEAVYTAEFLQASSSGGQ